MTDRKMIEWTRPKYKALGRAYNAAVTAGLITFTFDGDEYVTGYAKYLLEYLKEKFQ